MIRGFDASNIQGDIPWQALKDAGIKYVYLRCGVGNDPKDSRFDRYVQEAKSHGIIVAPYHFLYPLPHLDPVAQAEAHFAAAGGVGCAVGDLPAAGDLEWPPREERAKTGEIIDTWKKWGCTRIQINEWAVKYFKRYAELQGAPMVLYIYPYFAQCLSPLSTELALNVLWWASEWKAGAVPTDGNAPSNAIPGLWQGDVLAAPGARGFFWQHDGNGGITMPNGVDADFDVFVGTQEQFDTLTGVIQVTEAPAVSIPVTDHLPEIGDDGSGS